MIEPISAIFKLATKEIEECAPNDLIKEIMQNPEIIHKVLREKTPKINSIKAMDFLEKITMDALANESINFEMLDMQISLGFWAICAVSAYQESKLMGYKGRRALDFINSEMRKYKKDIRELVSSGVRSS